MTFVRISEIKPNEVLPGFRGRFVHGTGLTVAYWEIAEGSELPMHDHPQEMMINLIEGEMELTVGEETRTVVAGDVVVVPGNVTHGGRALKDCRVIDVWHPVRDDYQNAT